MVLRILVLQRRLISSRDWSLVLSSDYQTSDKLDKALIEILDAFKGKHKCKREGFEFYNGEITYPMMQVRDGKKVAMKESTNLTKEEKNDPDVATKKNGKLMGNLTVPKSTQDFVSAVVVLLKEDKCIYKTGAREEQKQSKLVLTSHPDPMAYVTSFGTSKPDLPFFAFPNTTSPHCITFQMDVKPRDDGEFTDEQIGHIIYMTKDLLAKQHEGRLGMLCGLTDGNRFQFFKVLRKGTGGGVTVVASRTYNGLEGWQVNSLLFLYFTTIWLTYCLNQSFVRY